MKRAPKKPILKPSEEEQQSPMGASTALQPGWNRFPFCQVSVKALNDCCSSRQTWRELNSVVAVLFTNLHIQLKTLTERFCEQRKNKTITKQNKFLKKELASIQKQTRAQITSPTGFVSCF